MPRWLEPQPGDEFAQYENADGTITPYPFEVAGLPKPPPAAPAPSIPSLAPSPLALGQAVPSWPGPSGGGIPSDGSALGIPQGVGGPPPPSPQPPGGPGPAGNLPPVEPGSLQPGQSQRSSYSTSTTAPVYTPAQADRIAKSSTEGGINAANQYADARVRAAAESTGRQLAQEQDLERQVGAVQANIADAQATVQSDLVKYQDAWLKEQERLTAAGLEAAKQARLRAERSIIEYSNMGPPDPGRLFKGKQGEANLALASMGAGIQAVLGLRGMKIDAISQINRNIDADINSQIAALDQKKAVTEGFRQAWSMVNQENQDREAARLQMRALYLDQFAQKEKAEALKYGAKLAELGSNQRILALERARDEALRDYEQKVHAQNQDDIRNVIARGNLSLGYAQIDASTKIAEMQAGAAGLAAKAKAREAAQASAIYNPITRQYVGQAIGDDKAVEVVRKSNEDYAQFNQKVLNFADKVKAVGAVYDGPLSKYWDDFKGDKEAMQLKAEYEALRSDYGRLVSGATVSDNEANRLGKTLFLEGSLTGGAAYETALNFADRLGIQANRVIQNRVIPGDPSQVAPETISGEVITAPSDAATRAGRRGEVVNAPKAKELGQGALEPLNSIPKWGRVTVAGGEAELTKDSRRDKVDELSKLALDQGASRDERLGAIEQLDTVAAKGKPGISEYARQAAGEVRRTISGSRWDVLGDELRARGDEAAQSVLQDLGLSGPVSQPSQVP